MCIVHTHTNTIQSISWNRKCDRLTRDDYMNVKCSAREFQVKNIVIWFSLSVVYFFLSDLKHFFLTNSFHPFFFLLSLYLYRPVRRVFVWSAGAQHQKVQPERLNCWAHVVAVVYHYIHRAQANWRILHQILFHYRFLWRKVANGYAKNAKRLAAHANRLHHLHIVIVKEFVCWFAVLVIRATIYVV